MLNSPCWTDLVELLPDLLDEKLFVEMLLDEITLCWLATRWAWWVTFCSSATSWGVVAASCYCHPLRWNLEWTVRWQDEEFKGASSLRSMIMKIQESLLNHLLTTIVSQSPDEVDLQSNCVVVVDHVLPIDVDDDVNSDVCLWNICRRLLLLRHLNCLVITVVLDAVVDVHLSSCCWACQSEVVVGDVNEDNDEQKGVVLNVVDQVRIQWSWCWCWPLPVQTFSREQLRWLCHRWPSCASHLCCSSSCSGDFLHCWLSNSDHCCWARYRDEHVKHSRAGPLLLSSVLSLSLTRCCCTYPHHPYGDVNRNVVPYGHVDVDIMLHKVDARQKMQLTRWPASTARWCCGSSWLLLMNPLMHSSKMVVCPLVHLDDLDADLGGDVESMSFDRTFCCRCRRATCCLLIVVAQSLLLVVVVQVVVVVQLLLSRCCWPLPDVRPCRRHSGCCAPWVQRACCEDVWDAKDCLLLCVR